MIGNIIATVVLIAVLGGAIAYIVKSKKNGKKCIGCPGGCSCDTKQNSCGSCSSCRQD